MPPKRRGIGGDRAYAISSTRSAALVNFAGQGSTATLMSPSKPLVSVVIPTINRPHLMTGAVASALGQDLRKIEVIVVVDGPDDETIRALQSIKDSRLRILGLPENVGLGGARHAGIDGARGQWVALLDDDDEWLPQKLTIQLDAALRSRHRFPIITCRVIARTPYSDALRPRRSLKEGEALSEYLFCRSRLLGGGGLILPSTLFAPRELFRDVRFRFRGAPFEGSDWLLRANQREGVGVEFVDTCEPLVVWRCDDSRARMSNTGNWRASLDWVNTQSGLISPRARAAFLLIRVSLEARRAGDAAAIWTLPREAFAHGRPTAIDLLTHAIIWLVPPKVRFAISAFLSRRLSSHAPVNQP